MIELHHLSKWYGFVLGVQDVHLTIPPGVTGVLGPNGSGKTTLLSLIAGLSKPSEGWVKIQGEKVWGNPNLRRRIAFCPDRGELFEHLSGREFLTILGRLRKIQEKKLCERVELLLEELDLKEVADQKVVTYSRGMRQRLKFAQALLLEDALVYLFDEPLQGADPASRKKMLDIIQSLGREGRCVLFSTHVLGEVERVTQQILTLSQGSVLAYGRVEEIRKLISSVPMRVELTSPRARELMAFLAAWEEVQGVQWLGEEKIEISTFHLSQFLERLHQGVPYPIHSLFCRDETLEEVFALLVKKREWHG